MRRWIRLPSLLLASVVAGAALAGPASAQAGERIRSYQADITIEGTGTILVRETIEYDFGAASRHGIFRDLPVRFFYDDTYDRVYPVDVLSVRASPGTPAGYEIQHEGQLLRIRIGDPDRTITGRHVYEIEYRVEGALNGFPEHDELYWNALGTEWPVPVDEVAVRVRSPGSIQRTDCFAGPAYSTRPCANAGSEGGTARFREASLGPHEGVSVVVAMPKGTVPSPSPVLEERWSLARAFSITPGTVGASLFLLLLGLGAVGTLLWRTGRDRRFRGSPVDVLHGSPDGTEQSVPLLERTVLVPEFAPPDGIRPGQIGTLLDEQAHPLDVSATIVDLAVRGFLTIEEVEKRWLFGKPDWRLIRRRADRSELREYEAILLDGLFEDWDDVLLSSLKKTFAGRLRRVQASLYRDAVAQGWFLARPDRIRQRWMMAGGAVLAAGAGLVWLAARFTHWGIVPIGIVLGGLALLAASGWMPRRTSRGTATLRRVLGFRMVIETSEVEFARFAEEENLFSRYLPYAIVFGAVDEWAKRFEGLARAPDTSNWYLSSRPFALAEFSGAMEGFATTTAGTIASTPSSSGGSGFSGGFSGGGGGGGGGGSW